jgi:hypothetical protein
MINSFEIKNLTILREASKGVTGKPQGTFTIVEDNRMIDYEGLFDFHLDLMMVEGNISINSRNMSFKASIPKGIRLVDDRDISVYIGKMLTDQFHIWMMSNGREY